MRRGGKNATRNPRRCSAIHRRLAILRGGSPPLATSFPPPNQHRTSAAPPSWPHLNSFLHQPLRPPFLTPSSSLSHHRRPHHLVLPPFNSQARKLSVLAQPQPPGNPSPPRSPTRTAPPSRLPRETVDIH